MHDWNEDHGVSGNWIWFWFLIIEALEIYNCNRITRF